MKPQTMGFKNNVCAKIILRHEARLSGPANGAVVEFVLPEKGVYTFVEHSFADATMGVKGAF